MCTLLTRSHELVGEIDLSNFTQGLNGSGRILLAAVILSALVLMVALVVWLINKVHGRNSEMTMKRDMLERGMSIEEIERMLTMRPNKKTSSAETAYYEKH